MRTIDADLTTEQQQPSGVPYVSAVIKNQVDNVRRLDFALINDTVNAAGKHDAAGDAAGNVHRVRVESGAIKYNRVLAADTGDDAAYDSWIDLATSRGANVAISSRGTRVIVVYTDTTGIFNLYFRESTDNGAKFGAETSITTTPGGAIQDLAVAYKDGAGDLLVAWCLAASMRAIKRASGTFGAISNPGDTFASLSGVAMTYAFDYELIITGQQVTTTKPAIWTRVYGDGIAQTVDTWSALKVMIIGETGLLSFVAPTLDYLDTWRAGFTEVPTWLGNATTRHFRTSLHQQLLFTAGPFSWHTPLPSDDDFTNGLALAHTPTHAYESGRHLVRRSSWELATLDLTADLLALEITELSLDAHGWLEVRNASKQYTAGNAPLLAVGNLIELAFGYYVPADGVNRSSQIQDLWITAVSRARDSGSGPAAR